jgi:hypothetical protein
MFNEGFEPQMKGDHEHYQLPFIDR